MRWHGCARALRPLHAPPCTCLARGLASTQQLCCTIWLLHGNEHTIITHNFAPTRAREHTRAARTNYSSLIMPRTRCHSPPLEAARPGPSSASRVRLLRGCSPGSSPCEPIAEPVDSSLLYRTIIVLNSTVLYYLSPVYSVFRIQPLKT